MIRGSGTVEFEDGRQLELRIFPNDLGRFERWALAHKQPTDPGVQPQTWAMFLLWSAATRYGATELGFEPWADTVADFDLELEAADPTQRARLAAQSVPSLS